MDSLYTEAATCTREMERVAALLESVRIQTEKRMEQATSLAQQAIFYLETRAIDIDGLIEAGGTTGATPFACPPLGALAALETPSPPPVTVRKMLAKDIEQFIHEIRTGNVSNVDELIRGGINPSFYNNYVFRLASENGHLAVVERLLQDARVDPSANDNEAIQMASVKGNLPVVERLLQDARVDPSTAGNRAIKVASRFGKLAVVDRLLQDVRVDPSADDNVAIKEASENGHLAIVERLLQDARVDPSAENNWAIKLASRFGHPRVVERLSRDPRVAKKQRGWFRSQWGF